MRPLQLLRTVRGSAFAALAVVLGCSSLLDFDDVEFTPGGAWDGGVDGAATGGAGLGGAAGMGGGIQGGAGGSMATGGTGLSGSGGASGSGAAGGAAGAGTGGAGATGGTGGGAAGVGGGAGCIASGSSGVSCSVPLANRLQPSSVSVSPNASGTVLLAPQPSGCSKAAWVAAGSVHITPLDGADQRFAADATVAGTEVRGLVAHDNAAGVLVRRDDMMVLVRVAANGASTFEQIIVGNNDHLSDGDKWIDSWPHEGRLGWSGSQYAAYFGHTGNLGAQGIHQGDILRHYDASGNPASGGWGWGCSHSLDVRIAHNGTRFGPVCLSDCYPGKGIYFNNNAALISDEPSGNCAGSSSAGLGGLVPVSDGFWFTYTSPEGRASADVALVHISHTGTVSSPIWLTNTPSDQERNAHLASYGQHLLAGWTEGSTTLIAVVDLSGNLVDGPATITHGFSQQSDFINFSNGDVGWASGAGSEITIVRLPTCT